MSATQLAASLGLPAPTPEQRKVIEAPLSSMLVVAGAGSGKTETMAARVVWLAVNDFVDPATVLGLTFTRKAARELRDRVTGRLRALGTGRWTTASEPFEVIPDVQTYHAYAGALLAEYGMLIGLEPDAQLLSAAGAWQLAHEVVTTYDGPMGDVDLAPSTVTRAVLSLGDQLAEHLCEPDRAALWCEDFASFVQGLASGSQGHVSGPVRKMLVRTAARRQILAVVAAYRRAKRDRGCLDFADQLAYAARLVHAHPWVAQRERERRGLVLLDEFQDTSPAQLGMLHALFGAGPMTARIPVIAVGDPHQSIYGWRGAGADTLGRFARKFAPPEGSLPTRALSTSWRNAERILGVANRVAAPLVKSGTVPVRRLVPAPTAPVGLVEFARCPDQAAEAALIANWIAARRAGAPAHAGPGAEKDPRWAERMDMAKDPAGGMDQPPSAAVLCRRREQIPVIAQALRAAGLPVEEVGVGGLVTTPEVAYLIAALTVTDDPDRNDAAMHLLMQPPVRLGVADLDAVGAWARECSRRHDHGDEPSLAEAVIQPPRRGWRGPEGERLGESARRRLAWLGAALARLSAVATLPLPDLVHAAERVLGLDVEVAARIDPTAATAGARHLRRFAEVVRDFADTASTPSLGTLLDWLDAARGEERGLASDTGPVDQACVQVSTVHAAKGLEWDVVAVAGLVEGWFPSARVGGSRCLGGDWIVSAPSDPGWITDVGALPGELRADREALPGLAWCGVNDLAGLRAAVDAFAERNAECGLAEERRLMYVATTRARHGLLVTAPVWTDSAKPRVTSRFLNELLPPGSNERVTAPYRARVLCWEPMPPDPAGQGQPPLGVTGDPPGNTTNPPGGTIGREADDGHADGSGADPGDGIVPGRGGRHADERREDTDRQDDSRGDGGRSAPILWPQEVPVPSAVEDAARRVADWQRGDGAALVDHTRDHPELAALDRQIAVLLAERDDARVRRSLDTDAPRGPLTVSDVVRLQADPLGRIEDAARPVPRKPLPGGRAGRAWHRWIERYYRYAGLFGEQPQAAAAPHRLDGSTLDGGPYEGERVDAAAVSAFLAGPWADRMPVALELPVDLLVAGVPVRGRIDAVFPDARDGFVIVDWKTGPPPTGEAAAAQALQLAIYRTAYARLAGVPVERVRACFSYAHDGSTVYPPLPDVEALQAFVEAAVR